MLVLSRKKYEQVVVTVPPSDKPTEVLVDLVDIRGDKCRLGFVAPDAVEIHRREVFDAIQREKAAAKDD